MKLQTLLCLILTATLLNTAFAAGERTAIEQHPYTEYMYDPAGDVVLARYNGGTISDLELYIYLQMIGHETPHLYDLFLNAKRPSDRAELSEEIQRHLKQYVRYQGTAPNGSLDVKVPGALDLYRRYLVNPIIEWVWLTEVLLPQIQIDPSDRAHYYQQNREDFATNESVQVRMLFRAAAEDISREADNEIHASMETLHQRLTEGYDFAELAREYSESPSAVNGGLLPPLEKGRYAFTIEEAIMNLQPGELSPVFRGPEGYYIMQCLQRFPYREQTIAEAQEDIDAELTPVALCAFHDLKFLQMTRMRDSLTDARSLHRRPLNQTIIQSKSMNVTMRQFLYMFPYIYQSPVEMDRKAIDRAVFRLHDGEMIAEQLRATPHIADPRIKRAAQLADTLIRANNFYASLALQTTPQVSEEEAREYYDNHRYDFAYDEQRRLFAITATPREISGMSPQEFVSRSEEFRQELLSLINDINEDVQSYNRQRAEWEGSGGLEQEIPRVADLDDETSPRAFLKFQRYAMRYPSFLADFDRYNIKELTFSVEDLGFITRAMNKTVWRLVSSVPEGQFSQVVERGPSWSVYYVDRLIPSIQRSYENARLDVREALINERIQNAFKKHHDTIDQNANLEFLFDPDLQLAAE